MQKGAGRRVKRLLYIDFRSVKLADEALKNSLLSDKLITEEQMQGQQVNIALFRLFIEQYLTNRTEVNEKQTLIVRQVEATPSGLPIEFYFFIKNSPDIHYEHTLADIMEHIYAYTHAFGLTIYQQYPEQ